MTSKKNEFLVYEGQILEEMIFIKDGRISFEAAINLYNPSISIKQYFYEKFSEFTNEKEKKIYESYCRTGFTSMMNNSTITYGKAQQKITKTFQAMNFISNSNNIDIFNLNRDTTEKTDEIYKFDINGGAIKNEDGDYQYLKILDIRKNEHFGIVFMTLNKSCPLSLQVKSKFAEIYLLKKINALNISRSYPNIWKRLYAKEFSNLKSIKKLTFKALRKCIEVNQLIINLNLDETLNNNVELTVNDLNELEKSIFADKSFRLNNYSKKRKEMFLNKRSSINIRLNNNDKKKSIFNNKLKKI